MKHITGQSINTRMAHIATFILAVTLFFSFYQTSRAETVIFQNGSLPTKSYQSVKDTQIRLKSPTTNYSGFSATETVQGGTGQRSVLLSWDLSSIPKNSVIQSARLILNTKYTSTQTFEIYKLNRNWVLDKTTWAQYNSLDKWTTAGAKATQDRDPKVLGTVLATKNGIYKTALNTDGVAVVQSWINNPASNFGFIIADSANSQYVGFSSNKDSNVAYRPALEITYIVPTTTTPTPTPTVLAPTITSFTSSPGTVVSSQTSTLSWSSTNSDKLILNPGNIVVTGLTSKVVTPTVNTTYTLTASNSQGMVTSSAVVTVTAATTTTTTTTSTSGTSECLNRTAGTLTTLTTSRIPFSSSLSSYARVDSRGVDYLGSTTLPLRLQGSSNACMSNGVIKGTFPISTDWSTMHDTYATNISAPNFLLENLRVHNYGDCIAIWKTAAGFTIRGAYCSQIRDDFVSNDDGLTGTIEDSFFDGGYVFFSDRSWAAASPDAVTTIKNNLVRLQDFEWTYKNDGKPGHGWFWKQDTTTNAVKLSLHGNVFMTESPSIHGNHVLEPSSILSCKKADGSPDNTIVWLGSGPYPRPDELKTGCFTLTTNRAVWDSAVTDWKVRHPGTKVLGATVGESIITPLFNTNLSEGAAHPDVKKLQTVLKEKGYYTGPITGYFGPLTKEALGAIQITAGIALDSTSPGFGLLGPRTRSLLNGS